MSRAPEVSRRRPEPSAFIRKIPEPSRAKAIRADCEASLAALDGLAIDLYLLHAPDPRTPWRTSVRALARLVDQGRVVAAHPQHTEVRSDGRAEATGELVMVRRGEVCDGEDAELV